MAWARDELRDFAAAVRALNFQYVEGAIAELLPFGAIVGDKDLRRIGRWVANADGLVWRRADAGAMQGLKARRANV